MRIMIVDDHSGMRDMLRTLLAAPGVEVCECGNGTEALAAYQRFQPNWVFMDSEMGELDGFTATRQLLSAFSNARVVMVSDENSAQLRKAARIAGACGFVPKDRLLEALRHQPAAASSQTEPLWMASIQEEF